MMKYKVISKSKVATRKASKARYDLRPKTEPENRIESAEATP
jgi:hypothetical protein